MKSVQKLLGNKTSEYVAIALMIAFIISDAKVPKVLGNSVDTLIGRIVVIVIAIYILILNHTLGVVALIFAYELINRSEKATGNYQMRHYLPSLEKKNSHLKAMNQFPVTLEEELVKKMIPTVSNDVVESSYKPVMNDVHEAAKL